MSVNIVLKQSSITSNTSLVAKDISANEGVATGIFILQVRDTRQLERITKKLKLIKGIIDLLRM